MVKLRAFNYVVTVNGMSKNVTVVDTTVDSANRYIYGKFGVQNVSGVYDTDSTVIVNLSNPDVSSASQYDMENSVIYT